jgi:hypothetical protein
MVGMNDSLGRQFREGQKSLQWLWESSAIFSLPEILCKSELTYGAIIGYFAYYRSADVRIQKSVVLREKLPEGVRIVQVFLDKNHHLTYASGECPYGRRLLVQALDQQLNSKFGKENLIVLE